MMNALYLPCQAILAVFMALISSQIAFSRLLACGDTLNNTNGTITKPRSVYNGSTSYTSCALVIDTRSHNTSHHAQHLQFHVTSFDVTGNMPYCNQGNYLEIFIGCTFVSIGRFCGVRSFPVFYSTDGCLALTFHGVIRDLQAEYSLRSSNREVERIPGGCGTSHLSNTRHGNIYSPRWPLPYPDYVDCVWTVKAHKNLKIKLIFFDFDVYAHAPCQQRDLLEVRVGSSGYTHARTLDTNNDKCGQKEPFDIIINSDTFYITFRSDKSKGPRGFMAGFVAYERETPAFEPQILIVFGGFLVILLMVSIKKFLLPYLYHMRHQISQNGFHPCWCLTSKDSGYSCCCCKNKTLTQIEDCPYLDTSDMPVIPKDYFLEPNDCWEFPSVESTFVPLHTPTPTVTKSASDIRCLSPVIGQTEYNERRPSCKSVRFASESRVPALYYS